MLRSQMICFFIILIFMSFTPKSFAAERFCLATLIDPDTSINSYAIPNLSKNEFYNSLFEDMASPRDHNKKLLMKFVNQFKVQSLEKTFVYILLNFYLNELVDKNNINKINEIKFQPKKIGDKDLLFQFRFSGLNSENIESEFVFDVMKNDPMIASLWETIFSFSEKFPNFSFDSILYETGRSTSRNISRNTNEHYIEEFIFSFLVPFSISRNTLFFSTYADNVSNLKMKNPFKKYRIQFSNLGFVDLFSLDMTKEEIKFVRTFGPPEYKEEAIVNIVENLYHWTNDSIISDRKKQIQAEIEGFKSKKGELENKRAARNRIQKLLLSSDKDYEELDTISEYEEKIKSHKFLTKQIDESIRKIEILIDRFVYSFYAFKLYAAHDPDAKFYEVWINQNLIIFDELLGLLEVLSNAGLSTSSFSEKLYEFRMHYTKGEKQGGMWVKQYGKVDLIQGDSISDWYNNLLNRVHLTDLKIKQIKEHVKAQSAETLIVKQVEGMLDNNFNTSKYPSVINLFNKHIQTLMEEFSGKVGQGNERLGYLAKELNANFITYNRMWHDLDSFSEKERVVHVASHEDGVSRFPNISVYELMRLLVMFDIQIMGVRRTWSSEYEYVKQLFNRLPEALANYRISNYEGTSEADILVNKIMMLELGLMPSDNFNLSTSVKLLAAPITQENYALPTQNLKSA